MYDIHTEWRRKAKCQEFKFEYSIIQTTSANIWISLYTETQKKAIIKIWRIHAKNCSISCIIFIKIIILNESIFHIIALTLCLIILDYKNLPFHTHLLLMFSFSSLDKSVFTLVVWTVKKPEGPFNFFGLWIYQIFL